MSDPHTVEINLGPLLDELEDLGLIQGEGSGPPPRVGYRTRDAGSYIGNQPWQGFRGDPISGTHNGKLDAGARARRAVKNARYRANRGGRAAGNQARGNRA